MYEYPFGNGQQLNLDWFLAEWKNLLAAWEAEKNGIDGALQAEIDRAEAALADVFAARDAAAQSAANALESKNAAAQSASDASGYLATVRADATTAHNAAQNAAQSESNAAGYAQTALASKNNAANSERNAAQSEANALASKNAAAQSAADALAHKDAAADSQTAAGNSASAAAQSASDAEDAAASVEASAQQIVTNTSDIRILNESLPNDAFNILTKDKSAYSENYLGAKFDNFVIDGCVTQQENICITSKSKKSPTITVFSQLTDDAFSVYLEAGKTYTLAVCIFSEYDVPNPAWTNNFTLCDYTTRTTKIYSINTDRVRSKEIYTTAITVPTSDYYAIKINFPLYSGVNYRVCFALYPPNNIYQLISTATALTLSN